MNLILLFSKDGTIYKFQERQNIVPFEAAFALFSIYSSLISILNFGVIPNALNNILGKVFTTIFSILFFVAGICIYFGVGFARRDVEAFGILVIVACLITRMFLIGFIIGIDPIVFNNYIFNIIFIIACIIRLNTVLKKYVIIRLESSPEIKIEYAQTTSVT